MMPTPWPRPPARPTGLFAAPAPANANANAAPSPLADTPTPAMLADPGYLVDRARMLFKQGRQAEAARMYAVRPAPVRPALDARRWVLST
jgi:soluble lytic murein transglycosylase